MSACLIFFSVLSTLATLGNLVTTQDDNSTPLCNQLKNGQKQILVAGFVEIDSTNNLVEFVLLTTDFIALKVPEDRFHFTNILMSGVNFWLDLQDASTFHLDSLIEAATELASDGGKLRGFFFTCSRCTPTNDDTPWRGAHLTLISTGTTEKAVIISLEPKNNLVLQYNSSDLRVPVEYPFFSIGSNLLTDVIPFYAYLDVARTTITRRAFQATAQNQLQYNDRVRYDTTTAINSTSEAGFIGLTERYALGFNGKDATVVYYPINPMPLTGSVSTTVPYSSFFRCSSIDQGTTEIATKKSGSHPGPAGSKSKLLFASFIAVAVLLLFVVIIACLVNSKKRKMMMKKKRSQSGKLPKKRRRNRRRTKHRGGRDSRSSDSDTFRSTGFKITSSDFF